MIFYAVEECWILISVLICKVTDIHIFLEWIETNNGPTLTGPSWVLILKSCLKYYNFLVHFMFGLLLAFLVFKIRKEPTLFELDPKTKKYRKIKKILENIRIPRWYSLVYFRFRLVLTFPVFKIRKGPKVFKLDPKTRKYRTIQKIPKNIQIPR